jgi:ketosteroid isomerase-like protein
VEARRCVSLDDTIRRPRLMIFRTLHRGATIAAVVIAAHGTPVGAQDESRSLAPLGTTTVSDSVVVHAAMAEFVDALNALDAPRMSADFADDITAFVPSAQVDRVGGKAAVTAVFQTFADRAKAAPRTTTVPEDIRIEVSGSLAVVNFMVRAKPPLSTKRRTFVFRKVGTRWLISHFHASDPVSPPR